MLLTSLTSEDMTGWLWVYATQIPVLLALLVGTILLLAKCRNSPKIAMFALAGVALYFASVVIPPALYGILNWSESNEKKDANLAEIYERIERLNRIASLVGSSLQSSAFGLQLAALLMGMKAARDLRVCQGSQPPKLPK